MLMPQFPLGIVPVERIPAVLTLLDDTLSFTLAGSNFVALSGGEWTSHQRAVDVEVDGDGFASVLTDRLVLGRSFELRSIPGITGDRIVIR